MGTVTHLKDWSTRSLPPEPGDALIVVSAYGFSSGRSFIAWQTICEIRGCKVERPIAGEALLEFVSGDLCIRVRERQPGFQALEAAVIAAFPTTATWREALSEQSFPTGHTLLYRRS